MQTIQKTVSYIYIVNESESLFRVPLCPSGVTHAWGCKAPAREVTPFGWH